MTPEEAIAAVKWYFMEPAEGVSHGDELNALAGVRVLVEQYDALLADAKLGRELRELAKGRSVTITEWLDRPGVYLVHETECHPDIAAAGTLDLAVSAALDRARQP